MKHKITIELTVKGTKAQIEACESAVDRLLDAGQIQDAITTAMRDEDDEEEVEIASALCTTQVVEDHAPNGVCIECGGIGWAVFEIDGPFEPEKYDPRPVWLQVQRDDSCRCLDSDEAAWEAARKASVPVDDNGFLPEEWTEEHADLAVKNARDAYALEIETARALEIETARALAQGGGR